MGRALRKSLPTILKNIDHELPKLTTVNGETVKTIIVKEIASQIGKNPTVEQYQAVIKVFDIEKAAENIAKAGLDQLF